MDAACHLMSAVIQGYAELISTEWLVGILLLISMTLQLVLVVLGAHRYHSSRGILRLMVWGAYIGADTVAITALGIMMHSGRSGIYGIWAPVLLLHLGGPDAITAYSTADNELWLRHGFNMLYQVSVAVRVIKSSALEGYPLVSAIFLLIAGATKYGERTLALWFASYSQILKSCLPISTYIKEKDVLKDRGYNVLQDRGYIIMGEKQVQRMIEKKSEESSVEGSGINAGREEPSLKERDKEARRGSPSSKGSDIEVGREAPSLEGREKEVGLQALSLEGRGIVTTKDVDNARLLRSATIKNSNMIEDYILCLSHALFKMYMRRFVSLYFDEGDWQETRAFWCKINGKQAFRIVEKELKFMYDVLFSKGSGTAFGTYGIVLRLLNCVLMGAAGFLILREREERKTQRTVTYVVISVAVVVEVFQFCRIMASDWTRVRLICARVDDIKHPLSNRAVKWLRISTLKVIEIAVLVLGKVQKLVEGDRYWSNGIHQHCLIGTCLNRSRFVRKMAKVLPNADIYFASWHTDTVSVPENLKDFIFDILKRICSPTKGIATCREEIFLFEEYIIEEESEIRDVVSAHDSLEEVILVWHIATTICDRHRKPSEMIQNENENVQWSIILSRYCSYLLVSRPRLLPVHPDMASIKYTKLVDQLMAKNYIRCSDSTVLGSGIKVARKLLENEEEKRWKLLAEYWAGLFISMAAYNKAAFHAECVAGGGEFLSQVWVLLGHMGCGEQSDSAVKKKMESSKGRVLQDQERDRARARLPRVRGGRVPFERELFGVPGI
ncbi:hypothetical protein SUGI_0341930 [Cryptomeria japonica]|uniref:uncharacterized protein LOC131033121 n=1 Tax=Cryptomeria japonica TaxID=3369 RepID=UPI002408EE53|nr:uncharacterized protein LOC131033121 [Cryptomeria japonica]GLJ19047.1 hypothetical protein SUGI_0341930 [Cryptomeria japonica]